MFTKFRELLSVEIMFQLIHSATPSSFIVSSAKSGLQVKIYGLRDFELIDVNLPLSSFFNVCAISGTTILCISTRVSLVCAEDFKLRSLLCMLKVKFEIFKYLPL